MFEQRLRQAIRAALGSRARLAAMRIDVDDMAGLNGVVGRGFADRVLRQAAARMARVLGPRGSLARLREDDFAAFTPVGDFAAAGELAQALLEACRAPYLLGGVSARATVSVGIALYPLHARECAALLRRAEKALHGAKALGGDRYFACPATCCAGTGRRPRTGRA